MDTPQAARAAAIRVTLNGMYLDLVLGFAKMISGTLSGSFALVVDGVHSLSDAATDVFVLVVSHFSHDEPDQEHPYGHGRFETIGTVVMGMILFAIAGILLYDSYLRLQRPNPVVPSWGGFLIAGLSVASKEWIYHYTMHTARRLNSSLLQANAWHSRTDAISSVAVMLGILGAQQGYPWLDLVAAAFVALIIGRIGWSLSLDALRELVDTAIPTRRQSALREAILGIQGIRAVTGLRSRQSGGKVLLEVQVQVTPHISVSEGHRLGEAVRALLIQSHADINDVIVHIDPEPHEIDPPPAEDALPLRDEIENAILKCWEALLPQAYISAIDLHYLRRSVEVDLHLRPGHGLGESLSMLAQALQPLGYVSRLRISESMADLTISLDPREVPTRPN